jgi:membrane-associated protein
VDVVDLLLHSDEYLLQLVQSYGPWIHGILFLIVFAETGLVVTPFLPGDSLLFAAGALGATGALDARVAAITLIVAAVVGNTVNYAIGRSVGARVIHLAQTDPQWRRWINPDYITRAHAFFEKHGGKAIVLTRFMPIVRTFVNIAGGVAWVAVCLGAGYLFGNVPFVKDNFSLVAIGIVIASLLPMLIELVRVRRS